MKKTICLLVLSFLSGILSGCSAGGSTNTQIRSDRQLLENVEKERTANPWGETQSLSVASEWAGFDFTPPAEEIRLDNGLTASLITYRYREGTAEALYRTDGNELSFRQSTDLQGPLLAEDNSAYPSGWNERILGHDVFCLGDGDTINLAYFDDAGFHFSITINRGKEGNGLTAADLSLIISTVLG